jgi:P pilus assembly chaperone PapD
MPKGLFFVSYRAVNLNRLFAFLFIIAVGFSFATAKAQGISLLPTRVIFDNANRTSEVMLMNRSNQTAKYRISFTNRSFKSDGSATEPKEPMGGQMFAEQMLRVSTREVTLRPNESRILRIFMRRLDNMPDGEYRSHLYISTVPDTAARVPALAKADGKDLSINIYPVYGMTIPVIVRQGTLESNFTIPEHRIEETPDGLGTLTLKLKNTGTRSIFGDVIVVRPGKGGKTEDVMTFKSVSVYWPTNERLFTAQLSAVQLADYKNHKWRVIYNEVNAEGKIIGEQKEKPLM